MRDAAFAFAIFIARHLSIFRYRLFIQRNVAQADTVIRRQTKTNLNRYKQ